MCGGGEYAGELECEVALTPELVPAPAQLEHAELQDSLRCLLQPTPRALEPGLARASVKRLHSAGADLKAAIKVDRVLHAHGVVRDSNGDLIDLLELIGQVVARVCGGREQIEQGFGHRIRAAMPESRNKGAISIVRVLASFAARPFRVSLPLLVRTASL